MSASRPSRREGGFSLTEISIALAVALVILALAGNILFSSARSVDSVVVDSLSDHELKKGITRLFNELKVSSTSVVSVASSSPEGDAITFQTPGEFTGAIAWGAFDAAGAWRSGWSVRYLVVKGDLVRRVLDGWGNRSGADEPLVRYVDAVRDGLKGFRLVQNGPLITAAIRVSRPLSDGHTFLREYTSAVHLKNT